MHKSYQSLQVNRIIYWPWPLLPPPATFLASIILISKSRPEVHFLHWWTLFWNKQLFPYCNYGEKCYIQLYLARSVTKLSQRVQGTLYSDLTFLLQTCNSSNLEVASEFTAYYTQTIFSCSIFSSWRQHPTYFD